MAKGKKKLGREAPAFFMAEAMDNTGAMDNQQVITRQDLAAFVRQLLADFQAAPESWENQTLPDFFEAMAAWIEDMDSWAMNQGKVMPAQPNWGTLANILEAATMYE